VKRKYHQLARAYHPDMKNGDDTLMKELNHSYQVLMEVFVI
jgi:DnaJ-class molecular chaperone